jgi:predicted dehydrogenase
MMAGADRCAAVMVDDRGVEAGGGQMAEMTGQQDSGEQHAPVRLGVIGAGAFACRRHLPDAINNPGVCLTAICRRAPEARAKIAAHFCVPAERAYGDWQQMLTETELDAVLIATPNAQHYEQAKAALERGLHVLIEKPMTIHAHEAHELVALAHAKNLQLAVALNPPYWAHCHQVRRALHDERMGALESAAMYWSGSAEYVFGRAPQPANLPGIVAPTMFRADPELNGGGYFTDGGSHLVSELLWVTGLRARRVTALMDQTPTDMRAALSIELENGAIATINSIGDSKLATRRVRNVFGATGGTVLIVNFEFETTIMVHGQEHRKFKEAELMPVAQPVANFVSAIQGHGKLFSPGTHGAQVVEVIEAAYESATTGRVVSLPASAVI